MSRSLPGGILGIPRLTLLMGLGLLPTSMVLSLG
jgi:hypothetical protein